MSSQQQTIGAIVRQRREAKGLSQAQLGERIGIVQPNIARIERGRQWPRDHQVLKALASFLNMEVDTLSTRLEQERLDARGAESDPEVPVSPSRNLRDLIEGKGFTQADVARQTKIDPGLLNRAIVHKARLHDEQIQAIADVIQVFYEDVAGTVMIGNKAGERKALAPLPTEEAAVRSGSATLAEVVVYRIKAFSFEQGWTKNRLATETGVRETTLRDMDEPNWSPTVDTLRRLEARLPSDYIPAAMAEWLETKERPDVAASTVSSCYMKVAVQGMLHLIADGMVRIDPAAQAEAIAFFSEWYARQVRERRQPVELTVEHAKALLELVGASRTGAN